MNIYKKKPTFFIIGLSVLLFGLPAYGQIDVSPKDTTVCPGNTYTINAQFASRLVSNINIDDQFGGVVNMGFDFDFYGQTYDKCIISANNFITFDLSKARQFSTWIWSSALASGDVNNAIMFPFQDVDMGRGGTILYQTVGQAPNRKFIVQFCHCPYYQCWTTFVTNELILYEGTNIIEMHITTNTSCPSWNGGTEIEGLRHNNLSDYVPGRGVPNNPWSATNDSYRFTPNGNNAYTVDSIAYDPYPIFTNVSPNQVTWYEEGNPNPIGHGFSVNVTANRDVGYYVVKATGLQSCDTSIATTTFWDTSWVHIGERYDTVSAAICQGESYNFYGRNLFQSGQYDTLFQSQLGCDSFITLNLTVNPLPDFSSLPLNQKYEFCQGDSVVLGLSKSEGNVNYQWYNNGGLIPGATNASYVARTSGDYVLMASTDKGCKDSTAIINVVVHDNPNAKIATIPPDVICAYDTLDLAVADPTFDNDYVWQPDKPFLYDVGNEEPKVRGVFLHPTKVTVTAYNKYGCSNSDSVFVNTKKCCEVPIPNAFSPNGDGLNDYFYPHLQTGQTLVFFQVFNRRGMLIYDNDDPGKGWHGIYPNGKPAAQGVYHYYIGYTCIDGKLYHRKGDVTLLR